LFTNETQNPCKHINNFVYENKLKEQGRCYNIDVAYTSVLSNDMHVKER